MPEWFHRIWTIMDQMHPLVVPIEVGGFVVVVVGGVLNWARRLKPDGYVARVERSRSYAAAASNAVHRLWPNDPLLTNDEYWELVKYNPDVLVSIFDDNNRMVGFFDVFPLKTEAAEYFLEGNATERTLLTKEAVYDSIHAQSSKYIYIGTVMGLPGVLRSAERLRLAYSMIQPMLEYLEKKYPPTSDRIYFSMACTKLGLKWMTHCGFSQRAIPPFARRKLRHVYQLDSERVNEARQKVRSLKTSYHTDRLLNIKCAWKDVPARKDLAADI